MAYNTNTYFILFLPIVMILYQLTPKKYRYLTLLAASASFFCLISKYLIYWCIITTAVAFLAGLWMEKIQDRAKSLEKGDKAGKARIKKKTFRVALLAIFITVGILVVLKYTQFTLAQINKVFGTRITFAKLAVPIGISFYTMQAVGYLLDVHWKRIKVEHNIGKFALFMTFFPTLMEGPILRWENVSHQLFEGEPITERSFEQGFIRIVWGLFKRMIIADRMNTMVNSLFNVKENYTGLMVVVMAFVVTVQLYMEFSGTIDIVIGSARIFNIKLPENFRQPFLAQNAAEFWRRWHISLGVWFKNYIFYPVSTSKTMKKWNKFGRKHCGTYLTNVVMSAIALFPVWMLNGLWHGPKSVYIMYGLFYFVVLLLEVMVKPVSDKVIHAIHCTDESAGVKIFRILKTWIIIGVGEVLFRAESWSHFTRIMKNIFQSPWDGDIKAKIVSLHVDVADLTVIALGIIVVTVVDLWLERKPDLFEVVVEKKPARRWVLYYAMLAAILWFGAYGAGYSPVALIYAGF